MRDDERRPPGAQRLQAVLDHCFALAVEARRRLVEDQDLRVGENRARDRDALPLAARQPDAALADDRVVALLEALDELVAVRDAAHRSDLLARGVRLRVGDVLGDRAVEEEVVLQHDPEMLAVVAQLDRGEVVAVDQDAARQRPVERHDQADQRALAGAARSDERRRRTRRRPKRDVLQHRHAGGVLKAHVVKRHLAADIRQRCPRRVFLILGGHTADLADAVEPGERFAQLRADRRQLNHGHRHQRRERQIHDEIADRHRAVPDRAAADQHHRDACRSDDQG